MLSEPPAPTARVERFLALVERERVVEHRRLALTSTHRPAPTSADPDILRALVHGKRHWHPDERAAPLDARALDALAAAELAVWATPPAAYPEHEHGWSVLNQIVDVCLVGDPAAVEARRAALTADADAARRRQTALTDALVARLDADPPPHLVAVALRGQYGDDARLPDDDIDLLALFEDPAGYPALRDRLDALVDGLAIGRISWLDTDFAGRVDHATIVRPAPPDATEPAALAALDIYATATRPELVRVLRGDPAESAANLAVLDAARPLWGADAYAAFVDRYRAVLDLRARARVGAFAADTPPCWAPVTPPTLDRALERGLDALADALPRVEMWSDGERATAMLSPFVAALVIEALAHHPAAHALTDHPAADARRRMADYLRASGPDGVWAFAPHADVPWPPDLDDTACALAALMACGDPPRVDLAALVADRLTPGGLVETWIIPAEALAGRVNDVDPVVTANALWCLDRLAARAPDRDLSALTRRLAAGLAAAVEAGPLTSAYYHRPALQAAFIARWAAADTSTEAAAIRAALAARMRPLDPRALPAVELAALVGVLARCGEAEATRVALPRLLAMQRPDGGWPTGAAFVDPGGGRYGSTALTTALAVDALAAARALFVPALKMESP